MSRPRANSTAGSGNILTDIAEGFVELVKDAGEFFYSLFSAIGKTISSFITSFTQQNSHVRYGFGSKSLKSGSIDCSGWTHTATIKAMEAVNAQHPGTYDIKRINGILSDGAAMQIQKLQAMGATVDASKIKDGTAPVGTLIGIRRQNPPGWAQGRFKDISHIVMITEKDGKKYISESGSGGVKLTPYDTWLSKNKSGTFYAANPFVLTNKGAELATSKPQQTSPRASSAYSSTQDEPRKSWPVRGHTQALSSLTQMVDDLSAGDPGFAGRWKINLSSPITQEDVYSPRPAKASWRTRPH